MRRIGLRLICRSTWPLQSERRPPQRRSRTVHAARCCSAPWRWGCCSSAGSSFISSSSSREVPLADESSNPLQRSLPGGIVPEDEVDRSEKRWLIIMLGMLAVMMAIVVVTAITHAMHPPSNVEPIDPVTLHLRGEFVESNLGTALEPDGVTVRLIAQQFSFVPNCAKVPAGTPVKFRLSSADVVHGFILVDTNVNTMVVPGFVSEVRTSFATPG